MIFPARGGLAAAALHPLPLTEDCMKRFALIALLAAFVAVPLAGCRKDKDNDDDTTIKVDPEGSTKSVDVDHH